MASIRQRSGSWQARVIRRGYPAEVRTFPTRRDAQEWARQIEASLDSGRFRPRSGANKALFRDILQRYSEEVSPTKRGHRDEVIRIHALMRTRVAAHAMEKLRAEHVAAFRDERLTAVGAGAVIRDLSLLSSVFNHARREWGVTTDNPCLLVKKPPAPYGRNRVLTTIEEERLLEALAPVGRRSREMLPLVKLALQSGMRRGELLALRWEDIDLDVRTAYLPTSKNGHPRLVPLSTAAVAILAAVPRAGEGRVFSISSHATVAAFKRATDRASIQGLRFHDLRHTAISRMASRLPNVIELAAVTGHRSIQMLSRYYHPSAKSLAAKLG